MPPLQCLSIAGMLVVLAADSGSGARTRATPVQIDVVAKDYTFGPLPAHIAAGPTVFAFANQGSVQHEMSIARLKVGATPEALVKAVRDGGPRRDIIERWVGLLISGPGRSPDGRLLVDLLPATTYVVLCNLKDSPTAPGHLTLGMYTSFRTE
jgi:plastocyanin